MLRRLLLALLMVCLAAPAMAMQGRCEPVAVDVQKPGEHAVHHEGHEKHSSDSGMAGKATHECIGCIAPYHALPQTALPLVMTGMTGASQPETLNTGPIRQPEPPPPRT